MHANTSGGSTTGALVNTIALGGDGQTVAGVPISPGATLVGWGHGVTIADTLRTATLASQDMEDPINGEAYDFGASSLLGLLHAYTNLPYRTGVRAITGRQNTAAANCFVYYMDLYSETSARTKYASGFGGKHKPKGVVLSTTLAAKTAITWGADAFSPTTAIPNGVYEIQGVWVSALTNYALIRFRHADFGIAAPGFPVVDMTNTAVANASTPKDDLFLYQGYQFVYLSQYLGIPVCPRFSVTNAGTGLRYEVLDIVADTPLVLLNIRKVGELGASGLA